MAFSMVERQTQEAIDLILAGVRDKWGASQFFQNTKRSRSD
jgi:hypothetical protein